MRQTLPKNINHWIAKMSRAADERSGSFLFGMKSAEQRGLIDYSKKDATLGHERQSILY
jgi:hypothetical protein